MKKILVAVDGSKNARRALMEAKKIGTAFNSEIIIIHVIEDLANPSTFYASYTSGHAATVQREMEEKSRELLDTYMEDFRDYEGKVESITRRGRPGTIIKKVAEDESCDLIVMGSRGLGAFSRAMLGSISNKVVNKAKMSVLIVK